MHLLIGSPICQDIMREVFMTCCGHSYCYACITQHLAKQSDCPICRNKLTRNQLYPNFHLNKVAEQRIKTLTARNEDTDTFSHMIRKEDRQNYENIVEKLSKTLPLPDLVSMLSTALERRKQIDADNTCIQNDLLQLFLEKLKETHKKAISELETQLSYIERDLQATIHGDTETAKGYALPWSNDSLLKDTGDKRKYSDVSNPGQSDDAKENDEMMTKKRRIDERFDDLRELYLDYCGGSRLDTNLDGFSSMLYEVTRFSRFKVLDTMYYTDISAASSIVSSIDFDRDEEYFAIGGVTKDIKVYDFGMMGSGYNPATEENDDSNETTDALHSSPGHEGIRRSIRSFGRHNYRPIVHCPVGVMQCGHKISCLSWNPYIKSQLASSDYEGIVNVWDTSTSQCIRSFEEHKHRAWSVDTCARNPTLLASGSDDSTVKIWSIQSRQSVHTLELRGNVCCAKFSPDNSYHLAVGSADHHASCYDLRFPKTPLIIFRGHRKAVSYVKWINSNEIVSA
ncbi:coatomer subunit alpha, partial [Apophysomyces sp. BC1021]